MVNKCDITGFINNAGLDKYVAKLATKSELKAEQEKILKLQAFDSSYFRGKSHFEDDGTQNYLVLQPMYRYFKNELNVPYQGNLKDCLMKTLNLLLQLIIVLLQD